VLRLNPESYLKQTARAPMPSLLYRAEPADSCRVTEVEGMALLYHRPSGVTHLLASPLPEMLALLREVPCGADILAERLCHRLAAPFDKEALTVVTQRLAELAAIGLVHSA
jgi:PqqD family protein of HPr-rel-A system